MKKKVKICPSCQKINEPKMKFCVKCKKKLLNKIVKLVETPKKFNKNKYEKLTKFFMRSLEDENILIEINSDYVVGRENGEKIFDDAYISKNHAVLMIREHSLLIKDVGSTNGTYINGHECTPDEVYIVNAFDEISLANSKFTIEMKEFFHSK